MKYKAIIFDLDGTLLDTLETLAYFCNSTLETFGFAPYEKDDYRYMVGDGAKVLVERMLRGRGEEAVKQFEKVYGAYIQEYHQNPLYKTEIYPGIESLLLALQEKGVKMAVLSNKPNEATVPIVKSFFGENTFRIARGAMEGVPVKPDPTAALDIIRSIGVSPEACVYVGDTAVDMETGKRAGFYTVGVLWGFREYDELSASGADKIVETPEEILTLFT